MFEFVASAHCANESIEVKELPRSSRAIADWDVCIRVAHSAEFNYVVLGKRIDDALIAIEQDDPRLKGIFDQQFALIREKLAKLGYSLEMQ